MAEIKEIYKGAAKDFVPRSDTTQRLLVDVGLIAQANPDDMVGYVVFAVDKEGRTSFAGYAEPNSVMSFDMVAGLAQGKITEAMVVNPAIQKALIAAGPAAPESSPE